MKRITSNSLCLAAAILLCAGGSLLSAAGTRQHGAAQLADSIRAKRKEPTSIERAAFHKFALKNGKGWKIRYSPRTALPEAITGGRTARYPGGPEKAASSFFAENKDLLKIDPSSLQLANKKEYLGITHLQYQQYYKGLPVEFSYARAHVTTSGEIAGYQAKFEPDIDISIVPSIPASQAVQAAAADLGRQLKVTGSQLVLFPDEADSKLKLAWKVNGRAAGGVWIYYVNALTGEILLKYDDLRRALCNSIAYPTMGHSSATVYPISPRPSGNSDSTLLQSDWTKPVALPVNDQYFWVGGDSTYTVTGQLSDGDYCSSIHGKVFSTFKGPYFSVTNAHGLSAHFDNGHGTWTTYAHNPWTQSAHPYATGPDVTYPVAIPSTAYSSLGVFMKAVPVFDSMNVGTMDENGDVTNADMLQVKNDAFASDNTVAGYIGQHTKAFFGASVENSSYTLVLKTGGIGGISGFSAGGRFPEGDTAANNGFVVKISSFMYLPNGYDSGPSSSNNGTGTVVWSTNTAGVYLDTGLGGTTGLDEANAFYHLNAARRFHQTLNVNLNSGDKPIDLDRRVPVMVHANGTPDAVPYSGMLNGYYDQDNDDIALGDGPYDNGMNLRSFSLDGTVLRHEYTHLVVNRIYPVINFGEFGALSEGMADYFSLASFWREGDSDHLTDKVNLTTLGNFLGFGSRDLSGTDKVMPASWDGEIHDDSMILTQALYSMRKGAYPLGTMPPGSGSLTGMPVADVLFWGALFYFPDNFTNYYDAVVETCKQLETIIPNSCNASGASKIPAITHAFADHGIPFLPGASGDSYETGANSGLCENNNGPECATELNSLSPVSATIYPAADVDYYALPVAAGNFQATLSLPAGTDEGTYKAYSLYLFDSNRNVLYDADGNEISAVPQINGGFCPVSGDCLTFTPSVSLYYPAAPAGRYYLVVAGGPTEYYDNSGVNSASPYTLTFSYVRKGAISAQLDAGSAADNDRITFTAPYGVFSMAASPSSNTLTGAEEIFSYAQLRDQDGKTLDLARTNYAAPLLKVEGVPDNTIRDVSGNYYITGNLRVQPGFSARYPGVGTVTVEVFASNHLGKVLSLGVSNPINLATNKSAMTAYNNLLSAPGAKAIVKYEIQTGGNLSIKVYTQTGTLVNTLYDGAAPAGKGTVDWDGTNSSGRKAASGIYFVKAKGPGLNYIDKIAIVR